MRKQCLECGSVNFVTDESCNKCGSQKFATILSKASTEIPESPEKLSDGGFLICLVLAITVEAIPLFLFLAEAGMRHSSNAPTSNSGILAYFLHLPTILLSWAIGSMFAPFVPITQIMFWTYLFLKIRQKLSS